MTDQSSLATVKGFLQKRFQFFLGALLLLFVVTPFLERSVSRDIVQSVILIFGVYAVRTSRRVFVISLFLLVLTLAASWSTYFIQLEFLLHVGLVAYFAFFAIVSVVILSHVFRARRVTPEIIAGAICVYLLIGAMWAIIFTMMEAVQPNSFSGGETQISSTNSEVAQHVDLSHFSYYSFVTLTTLGYGEIAPLTPPARSLAALEAIVGQLFLAVLIARLVGLHIVSEGQEDKARTTIS